MKIKKMKKLGKSKVNILGRSHAIHAHEATIKVQDKIQIALTKLSILVGKELARLDKKLIKDKK